jgi:hypothetical protein
MDQLQNGHFLLVCRTYQICVQLSPTPFVAPFLQGLLSSPLGIQGHSSWGLFLQGFVNNALEGTTLGKGLVS